MARGILSEFGPDAPKTMEPRATRGGVMKARDVNMYQPPQGPIGITRTPGPGLGGSNLGCCGTQGRHDTDGDGGSGSPGLHGMNQGMGTNRKG
jgi:hypothetical protein